MYIVAGLGNPGKEYDGTRHNVGFEVVDQLADMLDVDVSSKKFRSYWGRGRIGREPVLLIKPQTYMNLSGESIKKFIDYYKVDASARLIVVYDDISLDPGMLRIRKQGSAGGHNGMKNIIAHLGHQQFQRVRIGIGEKPKGYDLADYVLSRFKKGEQELVRDAVREGARAVECMITEGIDAAMNQYNRSKNI